MSADRTRAADALVLAERALATLNELAPLRSPSVVERDAAIKRFEYSFDTGWKAGRQFLLATHGVDERSPKGVVRAARSVGVLSDEDAEQILAMADDRNLTVHTYNQALASEIFARLAGHSALLTRWIDAMRRKL